MALIAVCGCRTIEVPPSAPSCRYEVTSLGEVPVRSGPDGLSGITHVSNSLYLAVSDVRGEWMLVDLFFEPDGRVRKCVNRKTGVFPGNRNAEGVAYDRALDAFWVCDENDASIHAFRDRLYVGSVDVPEVLRHSEPNRSLEALALSPDGLSLWTANEDTLPADGRLATRTNGGVVRLTRFSRTTPRDPWRLSGMWAYPTEKVDGGPYRNVAQSGVSGLAIAPDGSPIVLEREVSRPGLIPRFRTRIFLADVSMAADITRESELDGKFIGLVRKTPLYDATTGSANYEGIALGPELPDGGRHLVLVADNGSGCADRLAVLKLTCRKESCSR